MAGFVNLVTLTNEPPAGYTIPAIGQLLTVSVDQSPNAFTVGSCVVIADPSGLTTSQPYVGQVQVQDTTNNKLTLLTPWW